MEGALAGTGFMICKFTCPNGHVLQGLESQLGQPCICPQCGTTFIVQTISPATPAAPSAPLAPTTSYPFSPLSPILPSPLPTIPMPNAANPSAMPGPMSFPRPAPVRSPTPQPEASDPTAEGGIPDFNADWRREGFEFGGHDTATTESAGFEAAQDATDFTAPAPAGDSSDFLSSVAHSEDSQFDPASLEGLGGAAGGGDDHDLPNGADLPGATSTKFYHIRCPKKHLLEIRGDALNTDMDCPACGTRFHVRLDRTLEFRRKREHEQELQDAKRGQIWLSVAIAAGTIILLGLLALFILGNSGH